MILEIQKRLREVIKCSGMTQKEIAIKVGVNQSTISKYLCKDKYPALDTFAKLCITLDVSADDILGLNRTRAQNSNGLQDEYKDNLNK